MLIILCIYIYYMHKVLRGQPRRRGREVNINEVSDEVNNKDLRYQWGDVMNIVAKNWSPLKPVARGCVSTHANCKKHFLARDKFFLILSAFFSRRRSKDIWFQAFARLFSGSWGIKLFPARKVVSSRPLLQAQRKWLERSCSHACGREEEVV